MIVTEPDTQPAPARPGLIESADEGDRSSITDVNGTVAHFEMAYNPNDRTRYAFGPPVWQRVPSLVYLACALALACVVAVAYSGSSNSSLYVRIVEGDRNRPFGSVPLTFLVVLSAVGTVLRAGLRGVIVTRDGVEARYLLSLGVPRIRKWSWAQIDRLVIDERDVMLELWNGSYEKLPAVRESKKLGDLLERIASARGRTVTRLAPGR
jgi:hypothetical protein